MTKEQQKYKGRVILTYGRSLMALTAAHSLHRQGIEVIGCDSVDMTVLNFSRHVSDYFVHKPRREHVEDYLDSLEENIRKFKPKDNRPYVLMPMFRDAKVLAQYKERFEPLIQIAAPPVSAIQQVETKDVFADTVEKYGLKAPETYKLDSINGLEDIKDDVSFPCLIKPYNDVGGRGIHKAADYEELRALCEESIEHYGSMPLIQQVIEGEDYCLSTLCNNGDVIAHMAYHNLYQFPKDSGAGIMRETIDDTPFLRTAQKLLKALKWQGVAQFDFRWSGKEEDPAYLIEVNPRFWAGLFHSVESGVDFPWLLYQLTVSGKIDDNIDAEIGSATKVPGLWMASALQEIADSETNFSLLKEALLNSGQKRNWRDKLDLLKQALSDAVDEKDILAKLKTMGEQGKKAKSEFDMDDDPFIGLGVLFVLSSLIRNGEIPPELKS